MRAVKITLVNETEGHIFSEWTEEIDDELTPGEIYRQYQAEYGRCQSKVYIDRPNGAADHIGWYFIKADEYDRPVRTCQDRYCERPSHWSKRYLRGAWVTVGELIPATPERHIPARLS
jgi:hypothetical protein